MNYVDEIIERVSLRDTNEPEFCQSVKELLLSVRPLIEANEAVYRENGILERFVEPERIITFMVPWIDRNGKVQVNRGWRVQFNSAVGPYKGGLRFHSTVNQSVLKALGLEMVLKNALTGLPMGGAKGGSDFETKGKTDREVMAFCQSFMNELHKYIGPEEDCITSDLGCSSREIGYLFGHYRRLSSSFEGVMTSKDSVYGGILGRSEAIGYGLGHMVAEMCRSLGRTIEGSTVIVTGAGNVAIYAAEKCEKLGARVVAICDSAGYIHDPAGINVEVVKKIKEVEKGRIRDYADRVPGSVYTEGKGVWNIPCDIYLPCATQNELRLDAAEILVRNGLFLVAEGANKPTDKEAKQYFRKNGVLLMPGKAANAGGVTLSGLEQAQNAQHLCWTLDEVDARLKVIMEGIFRRVDYASRQYGLPGDYEDGINLAAFDRVASAMIAQGIA